MSTFVFDRIKNQDLHPQAKGHATSPEEQAAPERQTLTDSMASRQKNPSEYVDPKLLRQVMPRTLGQAVKPGEGQSEGQGEGAGGGHSHVHPRSYQDGQAIAGVSSVMGLAGGQADESPARRHEKAAPDAVAPNAPALGDEPKPSTSLSPSLSDAAQRKAPQPNGDDASNPFANIKPSTEAHTQHPKINIFGSFMPGEDNIRMVNEPKLESPTPEVPTPTRRRPRM